MADPSKWLEVLAWSKALFESTKGGIDFAATPQKNREDGATIRESERASQSYSSTYSDDELDAILKRARTSGPRAWTSASASVSKSLSHKGRSNEPRPLGSGAFGRFQPPLPNGRGS